MTDISTSIIQDGTVGHSQPHSFNEPALIQKLYASLTDKEGFHPFLSALIESLNANAGILINIGKRPLRTQYAWHAGLPDGFIQWYRENNMLEHDMVLSHAAHQMPGQFHSAIPLLVNEKIRQDYSRWTNEQNIVDTGWLVTHVEDDSVLVLLLQRTSEQQPFSQTDIEKMNRLAPYIRQAVGLYHQVHQQQEQASTLAGVINAIPNATLILNGQATVILANPMAYQIVQQEPGMQIQSERLQFQRREDHYRFFELVSDCIRASMGQQAYATGSMFIERHLQPPLIACLSPIEGIAQQRGGAMMTIYDPQVRQLSSAALIAEYFSLTKAEALLCEGLCSGLSLKDIAESRHKSEATLRSYLKQVFLKTGLNRQGQLVSHILAALMH